MKNRDINKKIFLLLIPFFIFSFKSMNCQACITKKMVASCFSYLCCRHKKTKYESVKDRVNKMPLGDIVSRLVLYNVADWNYKSFNGSSKEKTLLIKRKKLLEEQDSSQQPIQNQPEWCLLIPETNSEEKMTCQLQKPHSNKANQNARNSIVKRPALPPRNEGMVDPAAWPADVTKSSASGIAYQLTKDRPNKPSEEASEELLKALDLKTDQ